MVMLVLLRESQGLIEPVGLLPTMRTLLISSPVPAVLLPACLDHPGSLAAAGRGLMQAVLLL